MYSELELELATASGSGSETLNYRPGTPSRNSDDHDDHDYLTLNWGSGRHSPDSASGKAGHPCLAR